MTLPSSMAFELFRKSEEAYESIRENETLYREAEYLRLIDSQFLTAQKAYAIEISSVYSAAAVENLQLSRAIAQQVITDQGELDSNRAKEIIFHLKERRKKLICPYGEERNIRLQHIIMHLEYVLKSDEIQQLIQQISKPLGNRFAERAVLDTMRLPPDHVPSDAETRRAVFTALLTKLRQSLGSCFATAPAIMIHEEQPIIFLKDIDELLRTGKLTKVVQGVEYIVPMSRSWGNGEMKKAVSITFPLDQSPSQVWFSPIIIEAFNAVNNHTIDAISIYSLVDAVCREMRISQLHQFSFTVDEIITLILQELYQIPQKDLRSFTSENLSAASPLSRLRESTSTGLTSLSVLSANHNSDNNVSSSTSTTTSSHTEKLKIRSEYQKKVRTVLQIKEEISRQVKMQGECAILKLWEFTLASFAEVQFDLCRWNFYASLGFNWNDEDGIGQVLYSIGKECVDDANRELEKEKERFDAINIEVSYLEQRIQQVSTEQELAWVKMEYQSRKTEQYHIQQVCDQIAEKARKIAHIHQFLIDQYERLLKTYFQEVYDPDLHDVDVGVFDDSPAGFRLLYKHGRSNPSLWTPITSLDEFIDALASFFTLTEQELVSLPEVNGIEKEFGAIITRVVTHIRSQNFQESALNRTLAAHGLRPIKNPIQNLSTLEKKPWVFTSGGSMTSLVSSYFKLERQIDEEARWVENEIELFAFLIDTTRLAYNRVHLDSSIKKGFGKESISRSSFRSVESPSIKSLLMHSPTHAFRLLPDLEPFHEAWRSDMYSYSWINNHLRDPGVHFLKESLLPAVALEKLSRDIAGLFSQSLRNKAKDVIDYALTPFMRTFDVYAAIENSCTLDAYLRDEFQFLHRSGQLQEFFYTHFPYTDRERFIEIVQEYFQELENSGRRLAFRRESEKLIKNMADEALSSKEVFEYFLSLLAYAQGSPFSQSIDISSAINHLRRRWALFPKPIIVADSNWLKEYFGFLVSPISLEVELWAVSHLGVQGRPIPHWKRWLNGSDKSRTWGIFVTPMQYLF